MIATTTTYKVEPATLKYQVEPGRTHPLGSTPNKEGVNFSIFSKNATSVELLLFDKHDDPEPIQFIHLIPKINQSFLFWLVFV